MMAIVVSVLMTLTMVPAMILGTLTAFHVYQGHTSDENIAFVGALYGLTFDVFTSWTFALPAFSFDLIGLMALDFELVWQWRSVLPSGLLDVADGFTVLSFVGALVKVVVIFLNAGLDTILKSGLGGCLDMYDEAGGANVSLGGRAREEIDDDFFVENSESHTFEEKVTWWHKTYGASSLVVEANEVVKINVDEKYKDEFHLDLETIFKMFPNISELNLMGLKGVQGQCAKCSTMYADTIHIQAHFHVGQGARLCTSRV